MVDKCRHNISRLDCPECKMWDNACCLNAKQLADKISGLRERSRQAEEMSRQYAHEARDLERQARALDEILNG